MAEQVTQHILTFSKEAEVGLTQAQKLLKASSNDDVIRKAINLLNFVCQELAKGSYLVIENKQYNYRKEIVTI